MQFSSIAHNISINAISHLIMNIIEQYEKACNNIVKHFAKKQDIQFDYWIAEEIGGVAAFIGQYFFHISDIVLDMKTNHPKGLILQWHDENIEKRINYKSYISGLRVKDLE